MKRKTLLFSIALAFASLATVSPLVATYADNDFVSQTTETVYDTRNGLLTINTNDVCQTESGFVYLAQYIGLTKYDGIHFETIQSFVDEKGNNVSLEQIRCLGSLDDTLFVGTMTNGLVKYENDHYSKISSEAGDYIKDIVTIDKTVYVATNKGIFYIKNGETINTPTQNYDVISLTAIGDTIYFVDDNGACYSYDGVEIKLIYNAESVKSICKTSGGFFLGTANGDLICYANGGLTTFQVVKEQAINTMTYRDDILYIGTDVGVFYLEDGKIKELSGINAKNGISRIMFDYEGQMWISSANGVSKLQRNPVQNIFVKYNIDSKYVNANYFYKNQLYIGSDDGLTIIDEKNNEVVTNELTTKLSGIRIRDFVEYDNKLYIATYSSKAYAIVTYDGTNIGDISCDAFIENYDSLTMGGLTQVRCFSKHNDVLAIGTNYGLTLVKDGVYTTTPNNGSIKRPLAIYMDDNYIYSCSDGSGLVIYDYDLNYVKSILDDTDSVILRCIDYDGKLLISTGANLYVYSDDTLNKVEITHDGSISDLKIVGENVTICTTSGVIFTSKTDLADFEIDNYKTLNIKDGLYTGITANSSSYFDEENNTYYFSCQDSVYKYVNRGEANDLRQIKISIDSVVVDGKKVDFDENQPIKLDHKVNRLVVNFTVLSFKNYVSYEVYYKLSGFDKDYQSFAYTSSQALVYTNLAGGDYKLSLYVESSDGVTSAVIETPIQKEYKMSERLWFQIIVISFLVVVIGLIISIIAMIIVRRIQKTNEKMKGITVHAIEAIAHTIDAKDPYTNGHSQRVANYSVLIARELGYRKSDLEEIYYVSLLHDIGKIGVPDAVLKKPGRLTEEEYKKMKEHPVIGRNILNCIDSVEHISLGALCHHERYDGTGYPYGLKGETIPLIGRIICCADSFDAMNSGRCYREACAKDYIVNELKNCSGKQFDPKIVEVMIKLIDEGKVRIENEGENSDEN